MNRHAAVALTLGLLALPAVASAHTGPVTTVDFKFPFPAVSGFPAYSLSGSFSYDASKTGVIGINDLISFYFSDPTGGFFTLPDVQKFNNNAHFGWDTHTNSFVDSPIDIPSSDDSYTGKKYLISGRYIDPANNNFVEELDLPIASNTFFTYSICPPSRAGLPYLGCYYYGNSPVGLTIPLVQTADGHIPDAPAPGVPEPAAWATMLLGLGLAGTAIRRRRSALAAG